MKRYFALLLVLVMLTGGFASYADDVYEGEIELTFEDTDEVELEDVEAPEEDILLIEEEVGGEDLILDELALDLEGLEDQESPGVETDETDAAMATNASSDVNVGDYTYNFDDGGGKIINYNGSAKNVDVPSTVDYNGVTYKVVSIAAEAFKGNVTLESIMLPASLNSIGSSAFSGCTHLSKVTINSDLADCTDNVYRDHYRPFSNTGTYADSFTVEFGSGVTKIPAYIFYTGSSKSDNAYAHVTKVIIGDGVTSIGSCAFENCYDLTAVEWGEGLLNIGSSAFESDVGLTEIDLPSKTYSLGASVFSGCTFLSTVTLPASLNSIGSSAFSGCTHLSQVTINSDLADCTDNVYRDHYRPFSNTGTYADSFTVEFGSGVTKIPAHIFNTNNSKDSGNYCHVSTVIIPTSVKNIGAGAFNCCYDLGTVKYAGSQIDWSQINFGKNNTPLTAANIIYGDSGVAVTGVTLSQTSLALSKGASATLTVTIQPADATDKGVTWSSSNSDVATVSDGKVTAVGVGKATIKATSTSNASVSATCEVTVTEGTIPVTGVTISRSALSLSVGGSATLSASVQPADATEQGITWSSSNTSVATVSNSGVVKAVAAGTATIKAASSADSSKKATCTVTVSSDTVLATSIELDKSAVTLKVGETATLIRTILPSNVTTTKGSYKISNKAVFTVSSSKISGSKCKYTIKAVGEGEGTLTVYTKDGTNLSASCTISVIPDIPTKDLTKTGSNGTVKINKGTQLQLVASFATNKGWKIKSVTSSNKKVATVTSAGLVTAKKAGTATITVKTKNGKKATAKIKVVDPKTPTKVTLNKSGTVKLKKGKTLQLKATVLPDTAETTLTWKSSKTKVATVTQDGLVKAKKKGTATITVKTKNGKTAKVKIKVV